MDEVFGAVLVPRAGGMGGDVQDRPPVYKTVGIILAICSGVFIGLSFVLKKKGLLDANAKDQKEAGEGYGYLKNVWWWSGMILMAIGEICNFAAYLFVEAILVTPLGALSVVITAILSSIFLKERLSFVGKVGCLHCILGSVVILLNAPKQPSASTIEELKGFVVAPGFLSYAGIVIVGCAGIIFFLGPKWGNKSMLVYLSVCSLIGGLNVVAIQGLGVAITAQARGIPQFTNWFTYVVLAFVIVTLVVEVIYLNKALNIFNAAMVTPTYYVFFTSATIVSSAILFRGFKGGPIAIATVVLGFLQICCGVVLLQLSKSAKNVPDTEIFKGDLDQVHTIAEQEEPESEPRADAIRGTAAIIRRISTVRLQHEKEEAERIGKELEDTTALRPDITVEWDGVRRRVTWSGDPEKGGRRRSNTTRSHRRHAPLGLTQIPDEEEDISLQDNPNGGSRPPLARTNSSAKGPRRRSLSLDAGLNSDNRAAVLKDLGYDGTEDAQPTVWEKTKSLFVPKIRQSQPHTQPKHSSSAEDLSAPLHTPIASPYAARPSNNSSSSLQVPSFDRPYVDTSYQRPHTTGSPLALTTQTLSQHDAQPQTQSLLRPTTPPSPTAFSYTRSPKPSAPSSPIRSELQPPSSSSGKRQLSFTTFFHRRGHSSGSAKLGEGVDNESDMADREQDAGRVDRVGTEEEMLGLVSPTAGRRDGRGDVSRESLTRRSESESEEERKILRLPGNGRRR